MEIVTMIDGGFLRKKYHAAFKENISALQIKNFVGNIIKYSGFGGTNAYRVYFYDCRPCDAKTTYPVSNKALNLAKTTQYDESLKLINDIRGLDFFAFREGQLSFSGWKLKKKCYKETPYTDESFDLDLAQKGVDIKIGLDIAWISYNNISERILLVTGDSDFIPAIKTARRNGIFVHLFTLGHHVKDDLKLNADVCIENSISDLLEKNEDS